MVEEHSTIPMLDLVLVVSCYGIKQWPKDVLTLFSSFAMNSHDITFSFLVLFASPRFHHTGQLSQNSEFTVALSKLFLSHEN